MKVIFLNTFKKDIKKINDSSLKVAIKEIIIKLEQVNSLLEVDNIIKMAGYNKAYHAKIGNYRLGFYSHKNEVELARFVKRNDIYKVFPNKNKS